NLVNNCFAKVVLRRGHVLLHASAVSRNRQTVVLAGPPGAGKSTSALHLVEAGFHCLSNDPVLAKPLPDMVQALGYPKPPRARHPGSAAWPPAAARAPGPARSRRARHAARRRIVGTRAQVRRGPRPNLR